MLRHLSIRNYAIAEQLEIEFAAGLTAITGETGAGKSIILGALGLVLGDRADREVVRSGCQRADVSAEFDLTRLPQARQWLADNALDSPDEPNLCLIRRSVGVDGRSRAWINQTPSTLQALVTLADELMDIHSQHEHHSLLKRTTQQTLLDNYAGLQNQTAEMRRVADKWRQHTRELERLQAAAAEAAAQTELARYQLQELEAVGLSGDELQQLDQELDLLTHAESRLVSLQNLLHLTHDADEGSLLQALRQALHILNQVGGPQQAALEDMFSTALIQVEEATGELNRQIDHIEINPARLEEVNQRLSVIHQLARKHKVRPEELPERMHALQQTISLHSRNEDDTLRLQAEAAELRKAWRVLASEISERRLSAAAELAGAVNQQLHALAMTDAMLSLVLHPTETDQPQPHGLEQVEFLISTNAGQSSKPLARIASGGELSRVSLAIQVITAMTSDTPTLVFDEVDVGIGGTVARTVGRLLRQLGERCQVLCVTHQPLVAGQASQHLLVSKHTRDQQTTSQVQTLSDAERQLEIARMLGGETDHDKPTPQSLAHARALIDSA